MSSISLAQRLSFALFAVLVFLQSVVAVKFELLAEPQGSDANKRCISQFIGRDTYVVGTAEISDGYNQNIELEIVDISPARNHYYRNAKLQKVAKFAFTTHTHADVEFCFRNVLDPGFTPGPQYKRTVNLHVDTGAEAQDYTELAKKEKLKPMELELRKLENVVEELESLMEYMKERESAMRDTNEIANERVQWFSLLSMGVLVSVGIWQIWYLRRFFQTKKLI
ncbi:vesicle coat component [Quaeritorhiza haematococci]|nr:vesicle coat component [Quaeritorhiza haematococci]